MGFKFETPDRAPFTLSNDSYDKVISYYSIEDKPYTEILKILQQKYIIGDLERTVTRLNNY